MTAPTTTRPRRRTPTDGVTRCPVQAARRAPLLTDEQAPRAAPGVRRHPGPRQSGRRPMSTPTCDDTARRADKLAYHAICRLATATRTPACLTPGGPNACYGHWTETVANLALAYASGGQAAFDGAYTLQLAGDPGLCSLMASFDDADPLVRQLWSVAQLYDTNFPPLRWIVPDILPTGLSMESSQPIGKSWLAMQIAGAVGSGGYVLGRQVAQGKVLYLALEDTPRRLHDRLQKMGIGRNADIHFATEWPPFSLGGARELTQALGGGYTLVVVDTFDRAIGRADHGRHGHDPGHEPAAPHCRPRGRRPAPGGPPPQVRRRRGGRQPHRRHLRLDCQGRRDRPPSASTAGTASRTPRSNPRGATSRSRSWLCAGTPTTSPRSPRATRRSTSARSANVMCSRRWRGWAGPPSATWPTLRGKTGPTCMAGCKSWSSSPSSSARSRRGGSTTGSGGSGTEPTVRLCGISPLPATEDGGLLRWPLRLRRLTTGQRPRQQPQPRSPEAELGSVVAVVAW